jgi:glycosyltransferase involved in cell wall biosynthesis
MRPLLIVTPFFPPQAHAAVFRAYKIAKFLPEHGYRPIVVTVDTNYDYYETPDLLEALPDAVSVVRARHVDPTPRGVLHMLGLRDGSFKPPVSRATDPPSNGASAAPRVAAQLKRLVTHGLLRLPDRHWTWFAPALRACRRAVREHGVRLVLTSADPFTCYALGLALKADGLRWVSDLRDPPTHCRYMHSQYPWIYAVQRELERRAMDRADAVTVAAGSIGMILTEFHDVELAQKLRFIPTGLDESLLEPSGSLPGLPDGPFILFSGEYLPYYGDRFFRGFAAARRRDAVRRRGHRILVVGRTDVNRARLAPIVAQHGLEDVVEFREHQAQGALYTLIQKSEFVLLPYGELSRWWCLPAKLVDYLALRKPVLALVPDPSEARTRLSEAGLGIFLDGGDAVAEARLAEALVAGPGALTVNEAVCARYTAQRQVREFVDVFDRLLA